MARLPLVDLLNSMVVAGWLRKTHFLIGITKREGGLKA